MKDGVSIDSSDVIDLPDNGLVESAKNCKGEPVTFKEINRFLRECEEHIQQVYLEQTGWPVRIKLSLPPSVKMKIVKGELT